MVELEEEVEEREFQSRNHRGRDLIPDSVIFTLESNFSLFSSTSFSADRCSFASDIHDHDSLASEVTHSLTGHDVNESLSGPDRDPNKHTTVRKHSRLSRKAQKAKVKVTQSTYLGLCLSLIVLLQFEAVHQDDSEVELIKDIQNPTFDSARNSFSQALRECQERRSKSEAVTATKKADRRRPASFDLNNPGCNVASSSPRLGVMKKGSLSSRGTGTFPSPVTPNYRHGSVGMQKGWSSERVPLHTNATRRNVGGSALLPFNGGRTLPSKWEDAERWIFSPVSGDGAMTPSVPPPQRRPKSKSGPLGPPGNASYSLYSPATQVFDGGIVSNFVGKSPFSAGVIVADGLSIRCTGPNATFPAQAEPCMGRSVSIHGCSDMLSQSLLPDSQVEFIVEKLDGNKDAATNISRTVSRRDMGTQMSPEGSTHSSPMQRSLSPSLPSVLPVVELQSIHSSRLEVRDVEVDERVTMTRWSKKHRSRIPGKGSDIVDDWKTRAIEARSSTWEVAETAKNISKLVSSFSIHYFSTPFFVKVKADVLIMGSFCFLFKREEAKITAWENLQKAKAEAAIRKLEMKLEKKRSSSMDKIMNKLRSAQRRAQEMRSSVLATQAHQVARTSRKAVSIRRTRQMGSLSGCFTCHAF
ncbi:Remorin, C-terminal [Dillenia turbinata]|uniref:Remorin, C-terminal n=1 Tax=Dillenia turbinata TaxID=194707 RepID=A0AAN8W410_9MAGN